MKLSVEFPSVAYREGPEAIVNLARSTAIFQAGARSVDAIAEALGALHARLRAEVG